jgi:hydrophobic/amphiphilic exporter-1 (mainly G- bacteria), HAE1 family
MTPNDSQTGGRTTLADLCIRRPVFAAVMNIFLLVVGWIALRGMGVDQFPNVDIPSITVTAALPGASPEEMETSVAKPLEEIINTIEGVDELSSRSTEGACRISVNFLFTRTKDAAAQDVRDKINQILPRLPRGIEAPVISKFDADASPILQVCVSGQRSLKELSFIAQRQIKETLETVPNVGAVDLAGQQRRAVQIAADLDRLRAYGLTIADLRAALAAQNVEVPGGRVDQTTRELTLRTLGRVEKVGDFGDLNLASRGGVPIKLRDVATITDGVEEPRSLTRLNGENTVSLIVRKQSGTNTVEVIRGVKARLAALELPPDVRVDVMRDQSRFIERSLDEVSFHLLLGAVLVALTVFFFLHDWRGTLIASLAIPTSIIATFAILGAMGYTLNNFTMLGLVFAVGIVVDDAIVVVENIHRTLEERSLSPRDAAMAATREIALAVVATTLSLVVIFLPIPFMEGRTGRFFASYGVTVSVAIMVSMFVSFTLTPMLSSRMLRHTGDCNLRRKRAEGGAIMRALARWYDALLGWSLRHRWVIVLAAAGTMFSLGPLWQRTGVNFMPQDDSSEFEVSVVTPEGWTLAQCSDAVTRIEARLREIKIAGQPAVTDTLTTIGDTSGRSARGEGGVTTATIYCRLPELGGRYEQWRGRSRSWTQPEAMSEARKILRNFPNLRTSVQTLSRVGGSGSRNADIEIGLTGPELPALVTLSETLMSRLRETGSYMDVDTTLSNKKPELQARIDRDKASQFDVSVATVASTLRTAVGGEIAGSWKEGDEQYDIWLRADISNRNTEETIAQTAVRAGRDLLPLTNFVTFKESRGPGEIERYQRTRKVAVLANLNNVPLNEGMTRARAVVAGMDLPAGYDIVFTGRARSLDQTIFNFLKALLLSALFMYLILAAQFEHFIHPVSILLAAPLSLPFALLAMILLGQPLDIYAFFGIFMLFGVVKKNGILQVDYTNVLRARGMEREAAIRQANRVRLRPILMTTLLLVASMIPIALGTGPGAAGRASMATVIIGGQMLCLLLTLLVTPVTYSLFDDLGRLLTRKKRSRPEAEG